MILAGACGQADLPTNLTQVLSDPAVTAISHRSVPEIFAPGIISDGRWQWRLTFTPNRKTAYFAASDGFFPQTRHATIFVSHRRHDGSWGPPTIAPFSGVHSDMDPFITPNGRRLYFSSNRPVDGTPKADLDVWFVVRTRTGWSEPVHAGWEVNSELDELYASATAFGTVYFASGPFAPTPEADWSIYRARRAGRFFAPRQPLDGVNTDLPFDPTDPTADWEFNPEISKNAARSSSPPCVPAVTASVTSTSAVAGTAAMAGTADRRHPSTSDSRSTHPLMSSTQPYHVMAGLSISPARFSRRRSSRAASIRSGPRRSMSTCVAAAQCSLGGGGPALPSTPAAKAPGRAQQCPERMPCAAATTSATRRFRRFWGSPRRSRVFGCKAEGDRLDCKLAGRGAAR